MPVLQCKKASRHFSSSSDDKKLEEDSEDELEETGPYGLNLLEFGCIESLRNIKEYHAVSIINNEKVFNKKIKQDS